MWPISSITRKVLIIAPQPFFANRGTPLNVRAVAARLADLGYQVHLLVLPYGERIQMRGVRIHRCLRIPGIRSIPIGFSWQKTLYDFLLLASALLLTLFNDFEVYHGIEEAGVIAGIFGLVRRRPYVFDMDSDMMEQLNQTPVARVPFALSCLTRVEHYFIRRATAVVTVCEALSKKAGTLAARGRVFQIEDCPLECGTADPARVFALRAELGLRRENQILLYTGNFEPYQGVDLLLNAFAQLIQQVNNPEQVKLVVVGGQPAQIAEATARAELLKIPAHALRFVGHRPLEQMSDFMAAADVVVSPRTEGTNTPLKLYTYMACGKPIVATDIVSHSQVLDGDCAYLAPAEPMLFAKALQQALSAEPSEVSARSRKVDRARALVETKYSRRAFNGKVQELYTLLSGPLAIEPRSEAPAGVLSQSDIAPAGTELKQ